MSILGDRIKKEREKLNLTREDLAKKIGVSYSAIAMYEQGNREPSNAISIQMCKEFGCSMDYLMGLIDNYRNPKEDLEKKLYALDLSEDEFNNLISIIKEKKYTKYLTYKGTNKLFKACKLCAILNYDYTIPFNGELTQTQKEKVDVLQKQYYETQKKILLSLDKSKIIHNYKKTDLNMFLIPVLGKIAARQPILVEEYLEGYLPVDPNIYGMNIPDDYFYLKVSGESMNLKVHNGDYALIKKQDYAENGDIIVAIVNGDDEATLKKYKKLNEQFVLLEPMSTDHTIETITVDLKNTKFQIIGKAIGQFGKF